MNAVKHFMSFVLSVAVFGASAFALPSPAPGWSKETTEKYWAYIAETSSRYCTVPRFQKADAETGEGLLEAFGTRHMPNAYALYQKTREKALERESVYKENFPKGRESDATGGVLYAKVGRSVAKAVAEMDRRHDELCHYYLLYKIGLITSDELSKTDSSPICIILPTEEDPSAFKDYDIDRKSLTSAERTFEAKYLPAILSDYDYLANAFGEGKKTYSEIRSDIITMDAVRGNEILKRLALRLDMLRSNITPLVDIIKQQKLLHAVEEVTSEQLASIDEKKSGELQKVKKDCAVRAFMIKAIGESWDQVLLRSAYWSAPLVALPFCMVEIPGKEYAICKFEVTDKLFWNVKKDGGSSGSPVPCYASGKEVAEFVGRLNSLPEVKDAGWVFRIPTSEEWVFACKAGAKGEYCRLADGREITWETLGEVAWYTCDGYHKLREAMPVGLKKPNAYGLYDMLGNKQEWCDSDHSWLVYAMLGNRQGKCDVGPDWLDGSRPSKLLGGCYYNDYKECKSTSYIFDSDKLHPERGCIRLAGFKESKEVRRLRKAAEQGDAVAQNDLGYRHELGNGVVKNYAEAVKWYRKAAEQGNGNAQRSLGYHYQNGIVVVKDDVEAVKWFRKAAEQGHAQAQYDLGCCYAEGKGVEEDYSEAVKWYRKAAANGHDRATKLLKQMN